MPDEPTTSRAGDAPDPPAGQTETPAEEEEQRATPIGGEHRWVGPPRSPYEGSEAPLPGGWYRPHQTTPRPYDHGPPQNPYDHGPPQNPYDYGPPQNPYDYGPPQGPPPPYNWPYVPPPPPRPPLSPEERSRRVRRGLALAGVLLLAVGGGIGIGAAIAPTSPATLASNLVSHAVAAAADAGTYHYVELSTVFGEPDDIEGNAAPNGGQQLIRQRCSPVRSDTTSRTSIFDLRLVHGVVFFRGNIVSVVDELGVSASRAASLAGTWVRLVKGENAYKSFAEGITTSSNASQLRKAIIPTSSRLLSGSQSTEVLGAALTTKGRTYGTAVLVMSSSSSRPRTLRGSAVLQDTASYTVTWTFSRYREKVHVVAPRNPVPYSSLHAKPPAKTTCA